MSVSAAQGPIADRLPGERSERQREPRRLLLLECATITIVISTLVALLLVHESWRAVPFDEAVVWTALVAVTDLLPVRLWGNLTLALSLPILLAAAFVYPPEVGAVIAFLGSVDPRELRHEIPATRSLFNRSQVTASTWAAALVFHAFDVTLESWPLVLLAAMAAVVADAVVNWTLVSVGVRIKERSSIRSVIGHITIGDGTAYVAFGLVAVLLGLAFKAGGNWGLAAVAIPVFLARQVFVRSSELRDLALMLSEKSRMLLAVSEKIVDERRDERLTLAAALHDDLLPPLYKVHLLGQVIRQDLATGQLLALDDDVPDLVSATEEANATARSLIRNLRSSALGAGLSGTLQLLIRTISADSHLHIHAKISDVAGAPLVQLLAYQVAKEALTNVVRHSHANNVWLRLEQDGHEVRLIVEDDGVGFDPQGVDDTEHFGLQLMRERVELIGGAFSVDAAPGQGCRVVARLPGQLKK